MKGIVTQIDLELGVAVDRRAVREVAGLGAEGEDRVDGHRHHQHEDRHRGDHQDVPERDRSGRTPWRPGRGNQSIQSMITMPTAVATRLSSAMPEHGSLTQERRIAFPRPGHGARVYVQCRRRARRARRGASADLAPPDQPARRVRPRACTARRRGSATAGRRGGAGRPWRTGRAGGSPPRSPPGSRGGLPAQQLGGALHAHALQVERKLVSPASAKARWSWRREVATRRAMSSRASLSWNSSSMMRAASRKSARRRWTVAGRLASWSIYVPLRTAPSDRIGRPQ